MATNIQPLSDFITSRNRPRNKSPWPRVSTDSDDLSQLLHIFPDIDREYARLCLQQYTHGRVAAVTEKLLDKNFTNYPRHNFKDSYTDKNALLDEINELFPEHDVTELRQALSLQPHSNLYFAVNDLIQYENKLEKSKNELIIRTRVGLDRGVIDHPHRFRSEAYQAAVFKRLRLEFAEHDSPSTVRAVLSEHNYDYEQTKEALVRLFTKKSLWRTFMSWFSSSSKEAAEKKLKANPLTGCAGLDDEIAAIEREKRRAEESAQVSTDFVFAQKMNETEHELADEMVECGCCFGEYTWEDTTACKAGHLVCRSCVTHTVQECAFGQGDNSFDSRGLRCIAASKEPCDTVIPTAILEEFISTDLMARLTSRTVSAELESTRMDLVRCPFCVYAEYQEKYQEKQILPLLRVRTFWRRVLIGLLCLITLICPLLLANITVPVMICVEYTDFFHWKEWHHLVNTAYRRKWGGRIQQGSQIFHCRNVGECGRESCRDCFKEWAPFHDCLKDEKDGLRLYVEKAMADAVKRTCPRCNVGFIKSDGCNLMHCRCGFVMCYICRQDVQELGYQHFCQHFRPLGGPCRTCSKCGLYDKEDEEEAVKEARVRATKEYITRHPSSSKTFQSTVHEVIRSPLMQELKLGSLGVLMENVIDWLLEHGKDVVFETYSSR